jgi:hypothetical protein
MHLRQRIRALPDRRVTFRSRTAASPRRLDGKGWEGLTKQQRRFIDEMEQRPAEND